MRRFGFAVNGFALIHAAVGVAQDVGGGGGSSLKGAGRRFRLPAVAQGEESVNQQRNDDGGADKNGEYRGNVADADAAATARGRRGGTGIGRAETARHARRLRRRIAFGQLAAQNQQMLECGGGIGFGVGVVAIFVGGGVAFGADKVKALAFVLIADQIFFEQHKQAVGLPGQIQLGL